MRAPCPLLLLALTATASAFNLGGARIISHARSPARAATSLDETIFERTLEGTLEEEGAENPWMSEAGWADYLDKNAQSSYNMNQRPSKADDGYWTPDVFSNPIDVFTGWARGLIGQVSDPLGVSFMTITNDKTGARAWPTAEGEVKSRTITPKVKDILQKELRQTGLPGFGLFGAPSDDRVDDAKRGVGTKGNKNDAWKPKGLEKYKKPQN